MADSPSQSAPAPTAAGPWDDFVTGPENALAHAGALALARGEAMGISPLVVHGPSGVGKSRLLRGLVGEWLARRPGAALAHVEAEEFAALCAGAASGGDTAPWAEIRARFRSVELFALDDLPALEHAPLALNELMHTVDSLADAGASVAVSAASPPGQWRGWPNRLASRFAGGLAVRLDPPGLASRRRYLLDRARARGLRLATEALDILAEASDGYRTLDGWLARLTLAARLERRPIDAALVGEALADDGVVVAEKSGRDASSASDLHILTQLARDVARRFGVKPRELRAATRRKAVAEPRHLAMHLARRSTGLSFRAIGAYFGGRDSATVRHACRAAAARLAADPALAASIDGLGPRLTRRDATVAPARRE